MAQTFDYLNFVEGLYSDVSPLLVPPNALYLMSNVNTTYKIGSILKRAGIKLVGTAPEAKPIRSLYNFRQSNSIQKMLLTVDDSTSDDTQLFYSTGGAWTEITAAETAWTNYAGMDINMETFVGYCFFVGYGTTDGFLPPRTLTGVTFGTTNTTSMPSAKYIKRYRDRIYLGNCDISGTKHPYRVYYSDIPSGSPLSVGWNNTTNFIDADYGEEIKGLGSNWDRLIVFTEYSAYMYNQDQFKQIWDVGCSNHKTIKNSGGYMIWANKDGVWISTSGRPQNIAGRVIDYIRKVDMTDAFAEVVDEEYYLYLGSSVTVNGVTFSNACLIYNIPSKTWRLHEYGNNMYSLGKFYSSGQDYLYMGDQYGNIFQQGKYTDSTLLSGDDGVAIHSWFQTGALSFGSPSIVKELGKITTYSERGQGLLLKSRVLDRNVMSLSKFKKLGVVDRYSNEFTPNVNNGKFLQIEGTETSINPYWSLFGYSVNVDSDIPFVN